MFKQLVKVTRKTDNAWVHTVNPSEGSSALAPSCEAWGSSLRAKADPFDPFDECEASLFIASSHLMQFTAQ